MPEAKKSSFPKTRAELEAQGYKFLNRAQCRSKNCGRTIEWWQTPKGKRMPMDAMPEPESPATTHWATCPDAPSFRP